MEIKLEKITESIYKVYIKDSVYLGTFELDSDGLYKYWESKKLSGAWGSYELKLIAEKLDELNKPFDDSVEEYFEKGKLKEIVDLANENNIRMF